MSTCGRLVDLVHTPLNLMREGGGDPEAAGYGDVVVA